MGVILKRVLLIITVIVSCGAFADESKTLPQVPTTTKLSPQMRSTPLTSTKYTIQTAALSPYLDNSVIFDSIDAYEAQPYIVGFPDKHNLGGSGDLAYATGITQGENVSAYTILRQGSNYTNPDTKEFLGIQAITIGTAEVQSYGQPQILKITSANEHIEISSRLMQRTGLDLPAEIDAKPAKPGLNGVVLSVSSSRSGVGRYASIVVSLGDRDGLQLGDLLDLMEQPVKIPNEGSADHNVLPTKFGEVLIYKVMQKVSIGVIMQTTRGVAPGDSVASIPAS